MNDENYADTMVVLPNAIVLKYILVSPSGTMLALDGIQLVDFVNLGTLDGGDDPIGVKVSLPELLSFAVNPLRADGGRAALGSGDGFLEVLLRFDLGANFVFGAAPFSGGVNLRLFPCRPGQCSSAGSIGVNDAFYERLPDNVLPEHGILAVQVPNHSVNYPPVTPQPTPFWGYLVVEAPSWAVAYAFTPRQVSMCPAATNSCFRQGVGAIGGLY